MSGAGAARCGAVFLDRDGTLVHDPGHLHDPALVRLLPGVAEGLRELAADGWPLVVISNQAGIARGLYTAAAFESVMARIGELLDPHGVTLLASYYCPHHPDFTGPCECRKPGTLLYRRAAEAHGLELAASWYVGDRWRDVAPALALGGHGLLVTAEAGGAEAQDATAHDVPRVDDLRGAARHIRGHR